jgi:transposase-like protein
MPELVQEWDYEKNNLKPDEVMQRSNYKAWWKCSTCNHEWQARVYSRAQGRGCIKCSYSNGSRKSKAKMEVLD